MRHSNLVQ